MLLTSTPLSFSASLYSVSPLLLAASAFLFPPASWLSPPLPSPSAVLSLLVLAFFSSPPLLTAVSFSFLLHALISPAFQILIFKASASQLLPAPSVSPQVLASAFPPLAPFLSLASPSRSVFASLFLAALSFLFQIVLSVSCLFLLTPATSFLPILILKLLFIFLSQLFPELVLFLIASLVLLSPKPLSSPILRRETIV